MNNNYILGSTKYRPNPDHPHKHLQESLIFPPEKPIQPFIKPYRLILHSADRDSGTTDNATFFVDFKDPDMMNAKTFMMCVESFILQNTVTTTISNKMYYVRMGNLSRSMCQGKTLPKDVIQTVYGNTYQNPCPMASSLGVSIVDKSFLQNNNFNIYFTNNLNSYGVNTIAEIGDVNTVWSLTLLLWKIE